LPAEVNVSATGNYLSFAVASFLIFVRVMNYSSLAIFFSGFPGQAVEWRSSYHTRSFVITRLACRAIALATAGSGNPALKWLPMFEVFKSQLM